MRDRPLIHRRAASDPRLLTISLAGDAPMQGFGYLNGYPWYFRARGDAWSFAVGNVREMGFHVALAAAAHEGTGLVICGRYNDTTKMTEEKARRIIRRASRAVAAFLEG